MIIFLGIAGSGKSVQCKLLSEALDCQYISVGELLRKNADLLNHEKMMEGELLDDRTVINLVDSAIDSISQQEEFIIDGFPRTLEQAKWLVHKSNINSIRIIHIKVDSSEIIERLKLRNRQDDKIEAIDRRISEYNKSIKPILEEFDSDKIDIFDVDGSKPINDVHEQIINCIYKDRETKL
jgi:adenylate kinase